MSETDTSPSGIQRALLAALDKAISIHQPVVARHVCRIRRRHPEANPSDVIDRLAKQYLATMISMGAAAGGPAAAPVARTAPARRRRIAAAAIAPAASPRGATPAIPLRARRRTGSTPSTPGRRQASV